MNTHSGRGCGRMCSEHGCYAAACHRTERNRHTAGRLSRGAALFLFSPLRPHPLPLLLRLPHLAPLRRSLPRFRRPTLRHSADRVFRPPAAPVHDAPRRTHTAIIPLLPRVPLLVQPLPQRPLVIRRPIRQDSLLLSLARLRRQQAAAPGGGAAAAAAPAAAVRARKRPAAAKVHASQCMPLLQALAGIYSRIDTAAAPYCESCDAWCRRSKINERKRYRVRS